MTEEQQERFNEYGYIIIDDFLKGEDYAQILHELKYGSYGINLQVKPEHYAHVFKSEIKTLPNEAEQYVAKFSLMAEISKERGFDKLFYKYLIPTMKEACPQMKYALYPGAVRLKSGDVYRAHQDAYAGIIGYSYFVNDGWCWDYGGILTYVRDEYTSEMIYPKANRLLLRNEKFKHFHFLNSIESFCAKEQYIILGWADSTKGETSNVRGEYHDTERTW